MTFARMPDHHHQPQRREDRTDHDTDKTTKASAIKGGSRPLPPASTSTARHTPRFLTVPEVGELLRTSPSAIYSMVERHQIGGVRRLGRRILFSEIDLVEWVDRNCSQPSQGGGR
jgi:excisionase family DNA binding protein